MRSQIEVLEGEKSRLSDRLLQQTMTEEELKSRIRSLEKDAILNREKQHNYEKLLLEEKVRVADTVESIATLRRGHDEERERLLDQIRLLNDKLSVTREQGERDRERVQRDFEERIPLLVHKAVKARESEFRLLAEQAVEEERRTHAQEVTRLIQEVQSVRVFYEEKESRRRLLLTDERIELEQLRMKARDASVKVRDLEEKYDEARGRVRLYEDRLGSLSLPHQQMPLMLTNAPQTHYPSVPPGSSNSQHYHQYPQYTTQVRYVRYMYVTISLLSLSLSILLGSTTISPSSILSSISPSASCTTTCCTIVSEVTSPSHHCCHYCQSLS